MLLHAIVHPADIQDRDGGILLLATLFGMYPFLKKLFADGGYQGPEFQKALAKILPYLETEIVKRSDHAKGFVVLPRRWIVERTIAWLNRCRRLAKDWENLNRKALAFLRLASIRLMLRKLCNPFDVPGQNSQAPITAEDLTVMLEITTQCRVPTLKNRPRLSLQARLCAPAARACSTKIGVGLRGSMAALGSFSGPRCA